MTVEAQTPFNEHTGNGVTTTFGYTFQLLDADDLKVYVDGSLVNAADYTVNGVGVAAGGDVEFNTAPDDGADVLLSRELPLTRETNYATLGDLRAGTVNQDFDRLWQLAQQQEAQRGGMLRAPYPEQLDDLPASASRANKALVFDADGNPTVSEDDYDDQLADVTAQATIATTQAGIATTKAGEASTSAAAAAVSEANALSYLQAYRATSYGALASDPTEDPNGNPPTTGDEYFNTTDNLLKRFNGATWQASDISTANLAASGGSSLVGHIGAGTGSVQRTLQTKVREVVSVTDFGAAGNGATNDTAAIQAALDHVASLGGGEVHVPATANGYGWTGNLEIPLTVSLVGAGGASYAAGTFGGSRLVALDATATISFEQNGSAGNRGGDMRGLVIDGGGVAGGGATGLVFLDYLVWRSFSDILVTDSAGDGWVIHRSQNNRFFNCGYSRVQGVGLTFDRGAGGNVFFGFEGDSAEEYHVLCQEAYGDGPYARPTHNAFYHSIFERSISGSLDGIVRMTEGEHLLFDSCIFSPGASGEVASADALLQIGNGVDDCTLILRDARLYPRAGGSGIRQETGAGIFNEGVLNIYGGATETGWVYNGGYGARGNIRFGSTATQFGGSALASITSNLRNDFHGPSLNTVLSSEVLYAAWQRSGETYARVRVINAGFEFSNGSVNYDVNLQRRGPDQLGTSDQFVADLGVRVGNTSGPLWVSGAGDPGGAVAAPVGSIYSRTDGGAGTSLYVKESGTGTSGWVAK